MKKLFIIMVTVILFGAIVSTLDVSAAEIFDTREMTEDEYNYRNGRHIIERCVGMCLDNEGNGIIFNNDTYYNYINYSSIPWIQAGDIIITYFFYNPMSNYEDDIISRSDWVIANVYYYDNLEQGYFPEGF